MPGDARQTVCDRPAPIAQVALLVALAACRFDGDYDGTALSCPPTSPACPPGYACIAERCTRTIDGPPGDAGPDASVCELAALADDNDGCGDSIDLTSDALAPGGARAHGDTTGYANDLTPNSLPDCTGAQEPGPDAVYRLDLAAGDTVHLTLMPESWTGAVYLIDSCTGMVGDTCLGGAGSFSEEVIAITAAGTYFIVVDGPSSGAAGCFTLAARIER